MMVNPDVYGYTKTKNAEKTYTGKYPKNTKKHNLLKTKRMLKPKHKSSGGPCQVERFASLPSSALRHC